MKKLFKKDQRGFTLAELLIVVAIIGVLVAISIPIFTTQLEKSREATDMANIRTAYAEVMVQAVEEPNANYTKEVKLVQQQKDWQTTMTDKTVGGVDVAGLKVVKGGTVVVTYTANATVPTIAMKS